MRQNYIDDFDKLLNQPGNKSKYSSAPKGGTKFEEQDWKQATKKVYVDRDDPKYNENSLKKTQMAATEASSVNYTDLFG